MSIDKHCGNCLHASLRHDEAPCDACSFYGDGVPAQWEPQPGVDIGQALRTVTSPTPPSAALPADAKARKNIPVYSGFVAYFPRAICAVAELSRIGNDQHNPGKPLHWDRSKSGDEKDALMRHLLDQTIDGDQATDTDGVLHATKKAWRAMADLEKILEARANAVLTGAGPDDKP